MANDPIDLSPLSSREAIGAVRWSFACLFAATIAEAAIVLRSGSVALFADAIHNFGDAATALPLWLAFAFSARRPTRRFTYGFGRIEDLAGLVIVAAVLVSAVEAGWASIARLMHPQPIQNLDFVIAAATLSFLGNEAAALIRLKTGRKIGSAALTADGQHARLDGLASLGVVAGAILVHLGIPRADPVVGLIMTAMLLRIVYVSGREVFLRLLDGVDPATVEEIRTAAAGAPGLREVSEVRARWSGHRLYAEVNIAVDGDLSVTQGHAIAVEVRRQLLFRVAHLADATIHVDNPERSGARHH